MKSQPKKKFIGFNSLLVEKLRKNSYSKIKLS